MKVAGEPATQRIVQRALGQRRLPWLRRAPSATPIGSSSNQKSTSQMSSDDPQFEVVPAPRPHSKNEDLTLLIYIYNELTERQRLALDRGDLVECNSCAVRAGTPTLCASCLANRYLITTGARKTPRRQRRQLMRALLCLRELIARGGGIIQQGRDHTRWR